MLEAPGSASEAERPVALSHRVELETLQNGLKKFGRLGTLGQGHLRDPVPLQTAVKTTGIRF